MFDHNCFPHRFIFLTLAVSLSFFLLAPESKAQTVTGTLQGTVYDTKGAVVPGVEVVVRNVETGQERNLKTNDDGLFTAWAVGSLWALVSPNCKTAMRNADGYKIKLDSN